MIYWNKEIARALPVAAILCLLAAYAQPGSAQDLASLEKRTTVHTLDNGWTFILVERPVAPVFSFATVVDVGGAQEVPGITGLAHMFEHMAFKGTPNIGTTDHKAEAKALIEVEKAYHAYEKERTGLNPAEGRLEELLATFKEKQEKAGEYVIKNDFGDILEREGGVGLNAFTGGDLTGYFYSLPSNKVELFAYLESERFLHPVFREFYEERDVVKEERRLRTESQPVGRLIEQFTAAAFIAHPYRQPVVGYMSDLNSFTMTDAEAFYRKYYTPSNMITSVVGDIDTQKVIPILEKYFGRVPAGPKPPPLRTIEPPQIAEKTIVLEDPAQPFYIEAYHKPDVRHPDQPIYDAIDDILSTGRTSRLYRSLVRDEKIAVATQSFSGFPGDKYPNLWAVFAVPSRGITNEEVRDAIREEIERLKREDVSDGELEKFKARAKAGVLRGLRDNQGLGLQLADRQRLFGDWREVFHYLDRIEAVTKEDIRRVAGEALVATNRTVGMIVTETAENNDNAQGGE